jgi:hypothetical protein
MFEQALTDKTRRDLATLAGSGCLASSYLAGGTALALQLGHRLSVDLDFFTEQPFVPAELQEHLARYGTLEIEQLSEGTLSGRFHETQVSCMHYPYPLLKPTLPYAGIVLADPLDIACMKVSAIASRGTRRDFIDLYAICHQGQSLHSILEAFATKYRAVNFSRVHVLKSLVYFEDTEQELLPRLLHDISWDHVTAFFQHEVSRLSHW